jgi:hypothetical protein
MQQREWNFKDFQKMISIIISWANDITEINCGDYQELKMNYGLMKIART